MGKLKTFATGIRTVDARSVRPQPKMADDFYLSAEWRALMKQIIAKRGRRCEECGRTGTRIFGDHIVELKDGGAPLDEGNIKCLCGSCHTKKTVAVRASRLASRC